MRGTGQHISLHRGLLKHPHLSFVSDIQDIQGASESQRPDNKRLLDYRDKQEQLTTDALLHLLAKLKRYVVQTVLEEK